MSGTAWDTVLTIADGSLGTANIGCQNNAHNVNTYAAALVGARLNDNTYKTKAVSGIMAAMASGNPLTNSTECGADRISGLGRNLPPYVISAQIIHLSTLDPTFDAEFRAWLTQLPDMVDPTSGTTLRYFSAQRPSNKGTLPSAALASAWAYLEDTTSLATLAAQFKGWMGDRTSYTGYSTPTDGTTSWMCDPSQPVYIQPSCVLSSINQNIDGALPAEMIRGGSLAWCPVSTDYPYTALSGTFVEAEILYRQGYDTYNWQSQALNRAISFMYRLNTDCSWEFPTNNMYKWIPWVANFAYGTTLPTSTLGSSAYRGFNMGFTDWTHNRVR